jgi:hypothetical protein
MDFTTKAQCGYGLSLMEKSEIRASSGGLAAMGPSAQYWAKTVVSLWRNMD